MLTGNKGEWSEVYALLKVIADKQLYRGDGNLNRIEGAVLPIIKVLREESSGTYEYSIDQQIVVIHRAEESIRIPILEFKKWAENLLSTIKSSSQTTFTAPEIENFLASFKCTSLKARSDRKSDIRIVLHDTETGTSPELGFSIKSQLGGASTLLNAGKTTNFIYQVNGQQLSDDYLDTINDIKGVKDKLTRISALNCALTFTKTENPIFANNLRLIDSALPEILASIVLQFYSTNKNSELKTLVEQISVQNPLNFDDAQSHPFYLYKIKRFLTDIALGMMPSKVWTGKLEATGGYLIVKIDGEILSYHIYNRNDFEDYLYNNSKLETASTSRHDFARIYEENGNWFFKLNLQIRFIK
jgi:type II restriction enzyme